MQHRVEADIAMVKKMIGVSLNKQEILKMEYSKYSRTLHETELALNKTNTVSTKKDSHNEFSTYGYTLTDEQLLWR